MSKDSKKIAIVIPNLVVPGSGRAHIRFEDVLDRMEFPEGSEVKQFDTRRPHLFVNHKIIVLTVDQLKEAFPEVWD